MIGYYCKSKEEYLENIERLHRKVKTFATLAAPGLIWLIGSVIANDTVGQISRAVDFNEPARLSYLVLPIVAFVVPLEMSEAAMYGMKRFIKSFLIQNPEDDVPIEYGVIDLVINGIMRLAFDRMPLPRRR